VLSGLIIGPDDYMDRFPYWVGRIAEGGDVLAPGKPDRLLQVIDSRDLGQWMLLLAERRTPGVFNATGPEKPITMASVLEACRTASGSDARFVWMDDALLLERKVGPWEEMPLWVPENVEGFPQGFLQVSVRRAMDAGLTFRPLVDSARDTLAWVRTLPADRPTRAGLAREKERDLLDEWRTAVRAT
jgi:2'-hydroxyisoflavone reductase